MTKNRDPTQGVLSVFDFVQSRKYYGLQVPIPHLIETFASWWTFQRYHTDRYDPNGYIQGRKTGLHLNFIPKYKIQVRRDVDGGTIIQLDYWARIRKTGIVAALVTYGVTAAVGAGTLSYHVMEAKSFLQAFWQWFDGSFQVVKVEVLVNEERTALEQELNDGTNVSKTSTTTNNYYNTYQQQPPPYYPQQYSSTSSYQQQQELQQPSRPAPPPPIKSSGVVYPHSPIENHSPSSTGYPTPPTPSQIPIPPPNTLAGAAYSRKVITSPTVVGYQTTITSHTTSSYPITPVGLGMGTHSQFAGQDTQSLSGGYSYNGHQLEQIQHERPLSSGGSSSNYSSSHSSYENSSSGSYGQQQQQSSYGNDHFSGVQQQQQQQQQSGAYGSGYGSQKQETQQFVQSLFGSTPVSTHKPTPSTATLDHTSGSNSSSNSGSSHMGYNSSLPPYPSTATNLPPPPPPPTNKPQMVNGNSNGLNTNNSSSSSSSSSSNQSSNGGPYATGSYLGHEQEKKHTTDYSSLRHGGLGFGYNYDHLKEDIKRKSENLNKPKYGNASN